MEITATHTDTAAPEMLRIADDIDWNAGSAEPWVTEILAALLRGNATRNAIEIGGFQGYTSLRLLRALSVLPWPKSLTICEIDLDRAKLVRKALSRDGNCNYVTVVCADSLEWIPTLIDGTVDFVWLDGNHEKPHVAQEIMALLPKLAPGGLLCGHDCFGVCDLQEVFAVISAKIGWRSMSLDLPMLGPAGGVGIIQRPR